MHSPEWVALRLLMVPASAHTHAALSRHPQVVDGTSIGGGAHGPGVGSLEVVNHASVSRGAHDPGVDVGCDVATTLYCSATSIAAAVSVGVGGSRQWAMDMHGGGGSHSCVQNRFSYNNWKKKEHTLGPRGAIPLSPSLLSLSLLWDGW